MTQPPDEASETAQDGAEPPQDAAEQEAAPRHAKGQRSFLKELPFLLVLAVLLTVGLRYFVVQAFYIPSGSMEKTLMVGDRVVVNKIPYLYRDPHRGEIVVFNGLDNFDEGVTITQPTNPVSKVLRRISFLIGLGTPDEKDYIKRVIGVPGDRVMCCDEKGRIVVTPKGGTPAALDEPYIYQPDMSNMRYFCQAVAEHAVPDAKTCAPGSQGILVQPGRLWVMGDHRSDSADSRYHVPDSHHGTVPISKVVGKAFAVVTPFSHFGSLPVPSTFHQKALKALALPGGSLGAGFVGALPVALLRRRRLLRR